MDRKMDRKITTVCLMNSRRIHQTLRQLAEQRTICNDRHMAVVAALKLLEPAYQGVKVEKIFDDLKSRPDSELVSLARLIHPVMCSLKLEKWLKQSGQCQYLAESASPRDSVVRRILLDDNATEIKPAGKSTELWN